jgi:hypothetical protein
MLSHDHPFVLAEKDRMPSRKKQRHDEKEPDWELAHQAVRAQLKLPTPDYSATPQVDALHGVFAPDFCNRERELTTFIKANLKHQAYLARSGYYFFDTTAPTNHNRAWMPGMCPPILQRRWICCFHYDAVRDVGAFVRPLVGAEHMFLLGVNNFDRCGISDFRLRELAGSSMSCGYLSVLLSLLFGTVDFQTPLPALHAKLDGDPVHRSLPPRRSPFEGGHAT